MDFLNGVWFHAADAPYEGVSQNPIFLNDLIPSIISSICSSSFSFPFISVLFSFSFRLLQLYFFFLYSNLYSTFNMAS